VPSFFTSLDHIGTLEGDKKTGGYKKIRGTFSAHTDRYDEPGTPVYSHISLYKENT
jgi:hypothetical protein